MGNKPEIVSKLQFLYHLEENKLELGEVGRYGWWRVRCREFSGKFPKIWEKFPRKFREISGNSGKFPENGPDLLKFTEITEILKSLKIQYN